MKLWFGLFQAANLKRSFQPKFSFYSNFWNTPQLIFSPYDLKFASNSKQLGQNDYLTFFRAAHPANISLWKWCRLSRKDLAQYLDIDFQSALHNILKGHFPSKSCLYPFFSFYIKSSFLIFHTDFVHILTIWFTKLYHSEHELN